MDENIATQAALYGLTGRELRVRRDEVLEHLGLRDRRGDFVEALSGGLRRRVDLAKSLIHRPRLLLMDEPSTGLDPGARSDLWKYLRLLREQFETTIVLTSHLLAEADRADQVAILHEGRLVARGAPGALRSAIGGHSVTIEADDPAALCDQINQRFGCGASVVDGDVHIACSEDVNWVMALPAEFPEQVRSVKIGQPTLEDVFIQKTGHRFWNEPAQSVTAAAE